MTMRSRCVAGAIVLTWLLSAVTIHAAAPADDESSGQPQVIRHDSRGLVIDVGRFLPAGRSVRVLVGHRTSGRRRIHVDVERPGGTGVHVDVTVPVGEQTGEHAAAPVVADLGPPGPLPTETPLRQGTGRSKISDRPPVRAPRPSTATAPENYLGLFASPVPTALRAQLVEKVPAGEGLLVTHLVPNSPAANAGIKLFDVLLTYDGRSIRTAAALRRLIIGDSLGCSVVLGIIRSARRRTVTVVLGVRMPVDPRSQTFRLGSTRGSRWFRLRGREVIVFRQGSPSGPRAAKPAASGVVRVGRSDNSGDRTVLAARRKTHSFSIRCDRNCVCHLHVRYVGKIGKAVRRDFEGTAQTIQDKVVSLPPTVRSGVVSGLKEIGRDAKRRPTFRFHLQPNIQGDCQVLRLVIGRTTSDGASHLFQLEQALAGRGQLSVNDLLKNDALAEELKQLSPTIRGKVIATLRRVRFPTILVKVRNSL